MRGYYGWGSEYEKGREGDGLIGDEQEGEGKWKTKLWDADGKDGEKEKKWVRREG